VKNLAALVLACLLLASCGAAGDESDSVADAPVFEDPTDAGSGLPSTAPEIAIPVEPDGGIGDGAEPLPGAEEPADEGDWHGAQVAETNCPGTDFVRIEASDFSFSLPSSFVATDEKGIDSEVGFYEADGFEVTYDYGWYSNDLAGLPADEVVEIEYSGVFGDSVVVRNNAGWNNRNMVAIYFPRVGFEGGEPNRLNLVVMHDDSADEIIGRCIVGSLEWKFDR